jgi:hypothetical protein
MSTVHWHVTMSVDGFIAGPDDAMDRAFAAGGSSAIADDVMQNAGAIVAGPRWYRRGDRQVRRDLVDEIVIHVAPVLLGDGIRLYGEPGAGRGSRAHRRRRVGSGGRPALPSDQVTPLRTSLPSGCGTMRMYGRGAFQPSG